ncbi:MAG: fumarylacetoacetase [Rhodobacteraceae bacterium]|nr:MAG: fumarylacetoacetase [Paracoccaceae bacterium]
MNGPLPLNETHDPARRSSVSAANAPGCDFPIQNLPFGMFSLDGGAPRPGVAIGDMIVDLTAMQQAGAFSGEADLAARAAGEGRGLNALMALGQAPASALRAQLADHLDAEARAGFDLQKVLVPMGSARMHLPARIGDFTDFLTSSYHSMRMRKSDDLPLNFTSMPIAYHSRASSIRLSGEVIRPHVQTPDGDKPRFAPTTQFDYELEVGVFIGRGNELGHPIPIDEAESHVFGYCITNDWSLRDVQYFEGQPLGPFLSKSFTTTISPWIVTEEAMRPFRTAARPGNEDQPSPLPHLASDETARTGALDLDLEALLQTAKMRTENQDPVTLTRTNLKHLFWTFAQMIAHHSSNGCNLMPGDLLASGTASGPDPENRACLAEISARGTEPFDLPNGETRTFLEDGDELTLRAFARREGHVPIGFGAATGRVLPAT